MTGDKEYFENILVSWNGAKAEILPSNQLRPEEQPLFRAFSKILKSAVPEAQLLIDSLPAKSKAMINGRLRIEGVNGYDAKVRLFPGDQNLEIISQDGKISRTYHLNGHRWLFLDGTDQRRVLKSAPNIPLRDAIIDCIHGVERVCNITTSQNGTQAVISMSGSRPGEKWHIVEVTSDHNTQVEIDGSIVKPHERHIVKMEFNSHSQIHIKVPGFRPDEKARIAIVTEAMRYAAREAEFDLNFNATLPAFRMNEPQPFEGDLTADFLPAAKIKINTDNNEIVVLVRNIAQDHTYKHRFSNCGQPLNTDELVSAGLSREHASMSLGDLFVKFAKQPTTIKDILTPEQFKLLGDILELRARKEGRTSTAHAELRAAMEGGISRPTPDRASTFIRQVLQAKVPAT